MDEFEKFFFLCFIIKRSFIIKREKATNVNFFFLVYKIISVHPEFHFCKVIGVIVGICVFAALITFTELTSIKTTDQNPVYT